MTTRIGELEGAATTRDCEFVLVARAVRALKSCVASRDDTGNLEEVRPHEMLDRISELPELFKGLSRTVVGECMCVAKLVMEELMGAQ